MDSARHVIECVMTLRILSQTACYDMAGTIHQSSNLELNGNL